MLFSDRAVARACAALFALCCAACGTEIERLSATQITVRIYPEQKVLGQMAQLHVRSYRERTGYAQPRGERWFDKREIDEVVDIVLAATLDSFDEGGLAVVVDAVDPKGRVLAQTRATFEFVRSEQRLLELWLYPCLGRELGDLCSDPDCQGTECLTCVEGSCSVTPHYSGGALTTFDALEPRAEPKTPSWYQRPAEAGSADACAEDSCAPDADGGSDGGPLPSEAGVDGGPQTVDAGNDAGMDAGPDSGVGGDGGVVDGGRDAGMDAGPDGGPDASQDAATDAAHDAGTDSSGEPDRVVIPPPPPPPPTRCADSGAWTAVGFAGAIPARAAQLAGHTSSDRGSLPQYVCRVTTPDGNLTPAKVSRDPANTTRFDFGCFAAYQDGSRWLPYENFEASSRFEVLTPPSDCTLGWASMPSGGPLPARALATGRTIGGAPLYTCRITINRNDGSVMRMGMHLGRVGATVGEPCRVQYYGGVDQVSPPFDVLTQEAP